MSGTAERPTEQLVTEADPEHRHLAEEAGDALTAFSFVPGLTDTAMQAGLRELDAERFPQVEQFRRWHERGISKQPAVVAEALELALALPRGGLHGTGVGADVLLTAQARAGRGGGW